MFTHSVSAIHTGPSHAHINCIHEFLQINDTSIFGITGSTIAHLCYNKRYKESHNFITLTFPTIPNMLLFQPCPGYTL